MAALVWKNAKVYYAGYDLTADFNKVGFSAACDMKESTVFSKNSKTRVPGLLDCSFNCEGLFQAGASPALVDDVLSTKNGTAAIVTTIGPYGASVGDICYCANLAQGSYRPGASIGELMAFAADGSGAGEFFRGQIAEVGAKTATGNGTAYNLGAVAAGKKLMAAVQVLSVSGSGSPSITFFVESDDASGMATPVTRLTFSAMTALGAQWQSIAGHLADTHYRFKWTVSGTGPSFSVVLALGIQ